MDPENNSTNEKTFDFHGQHMTKDLNSGHSRAEMSTRRVAFPMLKPLLSYISMESRILFLYGRVHVASALVQILYAVFGILARAALSNGSASSRAIFLVYRNVIAAVFVAPLAFILERNARPTLTFTKLSQFFVTGLIGICINQTLFVTGLTYTSATFTATMQNLTPALTFALASLLRIEKIRLKTREGKAKVLGMIIALSGAMVIGLYKDPSLRTVGGSVVQRLVMLGSSSNASSKWGALCLLGNCLTWAIWFIIQKPVLKDYPAQLSVTAFTYVFGSIQLASIAICVERTPSVWASTFFSDFSAILYGGLFASGVAMTLQAWCAYEGGPILVAAYQPLQTILVAILSYVFLEETLSLGSLIGGLFIVVGLYLVLWGKSRETSGYIVVEDKLDDKSTLIISTEPREELRQPLLH